MCLRTLNAPSRTRAALVLLATTGIAAQARVASAQARPAPPTARSAPRPHSDLLRFDPHLTVAIESGAGGRAGSMRDTVRVGPVWRLQVGARLFKWLAVDAVYSGAYNHGRDEVVGPGANVVGSAGYGRLRLVAPLGIVEPSFDVGIGVNRTDVIVEPGAQTTLQSGTDAILPIGAGLSIRLGEHWGIAAGATITPCLTGCALSWNAHAGLGFRL